MTGLVLTFAMLACGGSSTLGPDEDGGSQNVHEVQVEPDSADVAVGDTVQFEARVVDGSGSEVSGYSFSWSVSDPSLATVDAGRVVGMDEGTVRLAVHATQSTDGVNASTASDGSALADTAGVIIGGGSPASVTVTPDSVALSEGGTTRLDATVRDASGERLARSVSWSSSNTSVATVDAQGQVQAQGAGETMITAESGDVTGAATVAVQGFGELETITRHPFDDLSNGGSWNVWEDANLSVVSDGAAPRSPDNVARARFPRGGDGGSAHGNFISVGFGQRGADTLHVTVWFRYSPDWQGHDSGVNKILYLLREGSVGGPVYISAQGIDGGPLEPQLRMQNSGESWSRVLEANLDAGKMITRGEWHRWDVRLVMNTGGQKDGSAEWWLDGVKVGEYHDVAWVPEGDPHVWGQVKFQPVWGGVGDSLSQDQLLYVDEIRVQGQ